MSDVLTYTVTTPNAVLPPKPLKMTLGSGTQVALEDPLIVAVALDGSLFVTKSDAPGKYVARPYSGDFAKALDAVVGEQGWPMEPLQIAMRLGKGIDGWLTALRFKQLAPLQISGYEKKTDQGRWFDEIHLLSIQTAKPSGPLARLACRAWSSLEPMARSINIIREVSLTCWRPSNTKRKTPVGQ